MVDFGELKDKAQALAAQHSDTIKQGISKTGDFVGKKVVADYLRNASEKELKASRKLLDAAGIRHDMEVRTGRVSKEILDCASSGKFDLLVMGAKGRSGIADLLLGSVAQRVLAMAGLPVLLVK